MGRICNYRCHCNKCGREFVVVSVNIGQKVKCEQCGSAWLEMREVGPEDLSDEQLRNSEEEFYKKYS